MTVQEIQEIGFEKAVFGGYDIQSVDSFLERVAEDFSAMQKENAALKTKMKVLVDKIAEYRDVEEGMRRTLASAQAIANETLNKAKKEAEQMVASAKSEAEQTIQTMQQQIALEEQKLELARKSTVEFIARVSASYQAQAKSLVDLVTSENLIRPEDNEQIMERASATPEQSGMASSSDVTSDTRPLSKDSNNGSNGPNGHMGHNGPVESGTRKFDFGELKFGADYDPKK